MTSNRNARAAHANAARGLTGIIDAMFETMASTVEAAFQVFAEAEEHASAARSRFPLAD
jgi:hypothetical protein